MITEGPLTFAPGTWLRPRPESWAFWPIRVALLSLWPAALLLLLTRGHWARTATGWVLFAAAVFISQAVLDRLRNPILDNALARRLAARTDQNASGVRVFYMLGVSVALAVCLALLFFVLSILPLPPSVPAFLGRHFN